MSKVNKMQKFRQQWKKTNNPNSMRLYRFPSFLLGATQLFALTYFSQQKKVSFENEFKWFPYESTQKHVFLRILQPTKKV